MRDERIDFYKGMLMIGVIWGHTITALHCTTHPCTIHTFFRTYDMPFFMFISGIFMALSIRKYNLKTLLANKITTLLVPVVFWSLLRSHGTAFSCYYFVWAVFFSSVIITIANLLSKKHIVQYCIYTIPLVGLHCVDWELYNLAYLYPFFLLGYLFFTPTFKLKQCAINRNFKYKDILLVTLYAALLCFWKTDYTPWKTGFNWLENPNIMPIAAYRFILAMLGIFIMKWGFDNLYKISIKSFICDVGKKTLGIYFLQGLIVEVTLSKICSSLRIHYQLQDIVNENFMCYIIAPIIALCTGWISLTLIKLIEKKKWISWTLGFKINI